MAVVCPRQFLPLNEGTKSRGQAKTLVCRQVMRSQNFLRSCDWHSSQIHFTELMVHVFWEECCIRVNVTHSFFDHFNQIIHSKNSKKWFEGSSREKLTISWFHQMLLYACVLASFLNRVRPPNGRNLLCMCVGLLL